MANLEIFGSSTTYGIGDPKGGGWATRIRNTMIGRMEDYDSTGTNIVYRSDARGVFTHNNAEPGMTLHEMAEVLSTSFARRNRRGYRGRLLVAVMVGFSEHVIPTDRGHPVQTLQEFNISLQAFSTKLQHSRFGTERLFVGLPLFDLSRPHPLNPGTFDLNRLADYEYAVIAHARETGAHYIPVAHTLRQIPEDTISHDGIHPNSIGHAAIHDIVLSRIDQLLGTREP